MAEIRGFYHSREVLVQSQRMEKRNVVDVDIEFEYHHIELGRKLLSLLAMIDIDLYVLFFLGYLCLYKSNQCSAKAI